MSDPRERIRNAWLGRISGCQLGKAVEILSFRRGHAGLSDYLAASGTPLRDYVVFHGDERGVHRPSCRGELARSEADDDINYSLLALILLEQHGLALQTVDVGRAWLRWLPAGLTYTAERAAYATLLNRAAERFVDGAEPGFDLAECADNPYSDWIGAQIRADVYGWVCPGRPALAADLARRDAALSHRGDGVEGAAFVAALGAALAVHEPQAALELALTELPPASGAAAAVRLGAALAGDPDGGARIRERYADLSPVHTLNNLALVVWALYSHLDDYSAAIGDVVAAGLDTDCNGATVGGLWGLMGGEIAAHWTDPWAGRVAFTLAGHAELGVETLVDRTVAVAERFEAAGRTGGPLRRAAQAGSTTQNTLPSGSSITVRP
ncbi:MAG TPA: ADP-ribosylglycohydrolase family protein [Caulobacteraceae bacterium]|nr:ADP-ribosylglycohydrolase family protein [Caulobacteraceae bacterium]